ncbi:hypothetical protein [Pectinatus frisingensis]|uniref:virion core protein, T7 gp14 family n=1 Tax=Pectinatus frisingensis TaxID=865 RepID=UPI0018C809A6|nr:hypothetical protein [Pectinatus frisingensis]
MCLPVLAVAGTLMNAIGAKQSADAQASAYEQQASIAKQNALYAQSQAANSAYNGAQAEQQIALKRQQVTGTQRADYGASGIDPNSGSALGVQNSSIMQSLSDQIQARQNAANQVYGYQTESVSDQNLASDYGSAASNAKSIGKWNMATTLLNGATNLSTMYGGYKSTGSNKNFWWSSPALTKNGSVT